MQDITSYPIPPHFSEFHTGTFYDSNKFLPPGGTIAEMAGKTAEKNPKPKYPNGLTGILSPKAFVLDIDIQNKKGAEKSELDGILGTISHNLGLPADCPKIKTKNGYHVPFFSDFPKTSKRIFETEYKNPDGSAIICELLTSHHQIVGLGKSFEGTGEIPTVPAEKLNRLFSLFFTEKQPKIQTLNPKFSLSNYATFLSETASEADRADFILSKNPVTFEGSTGFADAVFRLAAMSCRDGISEDTFIDRFSAVFDVPADKVKILDYNTRSAYKKTEFGKNRKNLNKALARPVKQKTEKNEFGKIVKTGQNQLTLKIKSKYLTDQNIKNPALTKFLSDIISVGKDLILQAPAGAGKNTYLYTLAAILRIKVLYCVPYNSQTEQAKTTSKVTTERINGELAAKKADFEKYGINALTSYDLQNLDAHEVAALMDSTNVVICTYDQAEKLANFWGDVLAVKIIDEFHNLVDQYGFRSAAIDKVLKKGSFKSVIFCSATPVNFGCFSDLPVLKIETENDQKFKIFPVNTGKIKDANQSVIINRLAQNRKGIVLIFWNGKEKGKVLKNYFVGKGYSPEQIAVIHKSTILKDDKNYIELTKNERLPEGVKIVICTAILKDGLNILNENVSDIIILSKNYRDIIQFTNRPRLAQNLNIYVLGSDKQGTNPADIATEYAKSKADFKRYKIGNSSKCATYAKELQINRTGVLRYVTAQGKFNKLKATSDASAAYINSIGINRVVSDILENDNRFSVASPAEISVLMTDLFSDKNALIAEKDEIKAISAERKIEFAAAKKTAKEEILENPAAYCQALAAVTEDINLKQKVSAAFGTKGKLDSQLLMPKIREKLTENEPAYIQTVERVTWLTATFGQNADLNKVSPDAEAGKGDQSIDRFDSYKNAFKAFRDIELFERGYLVEGTVEYGETQKTIRNIEKIKTAQKTAEKMYVSDLIQLVDHTAVRDNYGLVTYLKSFCPTISARSEKLAFVKKDGEEVKYSKKYIPKFKFLDLDSVFQFFGIDSAKYWEAETEKLKNRLAGRLSENRNVEAANHIIGMPSLMEISRKFELEPKEPGVPGSKEFDVLTEKETDFDFDFQYLDEASF